MPENSSTQSQDDRENSPAAGWSGRTRRRFPEPPAPAQSIALEVQGGQS